MDLLEEVEDDDGDMNDKGKWKNKQTFSPAIASVFVLAGLPPPTPRQPNKGKSMNSSNTTSDNCLETVTNAATGMNQHLVCKIH